MQLEFIRHAAAVMAGICSVVSCVEINEELGKEYIPTSHQYNVHTDTIYLKNILMKQTDSLSGYSSSRITVGAVKDPVFGLTVRSSAFTLIPVDPDMDFGDKPRCTQFHFTAVRDTLSWPEESQEHIIQNIKVYRLTEEIGEEAAYINCSDKLHYDAADPIARCTYFGQDSLSFDMKTDFGDEYIKAIQDMEDIGDVEDYSKILHGIYLKADAPIADGGRINMFELPIQVADSYYISGNYAELKFRSDYGHRKDVDTSFLFFFGAQAMQVYEDTESIYVTPDQTAQFALNLSDSDSRSWATDEDGAMPAGKTFYIEGGGGMKPVITAKEIKESLMNLFETEGVDAEEVIIHKATVVLPYDYEGTGYQKMFLYPDRLSPTCRLSLKDEDGESYVNFAGLTDASVESENQGDINRSLNCYAPDISHHVQEIIRRADETNYKDYDIWMLTMAKEIVETDSGSNSALSDYYQNLAYYDYYNSMYNPYGYGGYYGGYYGYDSYYGMSNYYNYMLAAQYASSQNSSTTTMSIQLDKDRYYRGVLYGPNENPSTREEKMKAPRLIVTYSTVK